MIDYSNATDNDINSLKELWLNNFEDNPKAVDLFFDRIFSPDITFVAKEGDTLVSMVYLLDTMVNGHKTAYLYAAATEKSYQGNGIMTNLVDYALNNSNAELCVTLPATASLYSFYKNLGFTPITQKTATFCRKSLENLAKSYPKEEVAVSNYCGIRNRVLKNNFLFWNNKHINYAFDYNSLYGVKVIKNNFGYAIFDDDNISTVYEIICDDINVPYMLNDILTLTNADTFNFRLSENQQYLLSKADKVSKENYGMVRYLSDYKTDNIYANLLLD